MRKGRERSAPSNKSPRQRRANNVTVVTAKRSNTKLIITSSSPKDLYLGDHVVTTGRLVDGEGNGIPNQTIVFKSVAHVLGLTHDNPVESATTDSPVRSQRYISRYQHRTLHLLSRRSMSKDG